MCGRFVLENSVEVIEEGFKIEEVVAYPGPSYNIAPGRDVAAVIETGKRKLVTFRWGLIPHWAKDPSIGSRMINARCETVGEKRSFAPSFKKRRCLLPASGFYEWKKGGKVKVPHFIYLKSGKPFGLASLYATWSPPGGPKVHTCTIITTDANELLKPVHARMPVIISGKDETAWLDPDFDDEGTLLSFLRPYPPGDMGFHEVSRMVNSPVNNSPDCIKDISANVYP